MTHELFKALSCASLLACLAQPCLAQSPSSSDIAAKLKKQDRNGDGRLSASELPPKQRKKLLLKLDRNKDGQLDGAELERLAKHLVKKKTKPARPTPRTPSDKVVAKTGIAYVTGPGYEGGLGELDVYRPRPGGSYPVLLWVHGGGLTGGDKMKSAEVCERFALDGFVVVTVNYRLSPAVLFPAHIEDVALAFKWCVDNAARFDGDAKRLFVTGGSAGGQLTALLSADGRYLAEHGLSPKQIRGAIPISPLVDLRTVPPGRLTTVWGNDPSVVERGSALTYARANMPPTLIMYAEHDTRARRDQDVAYYEALKQAGHNDVHIKELADRTHTSVRPNLVNVEDPSAVAMLRFMRDHGSNNKSLR